MADATRIGDDLFGRKPLQPKAGSRWAAVLESAAARPEHPAEVLGVAENIARAVGALFEAERASSDVDGKASVRHAMGSLSQTMALLQDVKSDARRASRQRHARWPRVMGQLYPLAQAPTVRPGSLLPVRARCQRQGAAGRAVPALARVDRPAPRRSHAASRCRQRPAGPREKLEANVGATTESNFFVGFSGDISEGGVFVATYVTLPMCGTAPRCW